MRTRTSKPPGHGSAPNAVSAVCTGRAPRRLALARRSTVLSPLTLLERADPSANFEDPIQDLHVSGQNRRCGYPGSTPTDGSSPPHQ